MKRAGTRAATTASASSLPSPRALAGLSGREGWSPAPAGAPPAPSPPPFFPPKHDAALPAAGEGLQDAGVGEECERVRGGVRVDVDVLTRHVGLLWGPPPLFEASRRWVGVGTHPLTEASGRRAAPQPLSLFPHGRTRRGGRTVGNGAPRPRGLSS